MHRDFFGDSYDLVKRYFCSHMKAMGLSVYLDPMFTDDGKWDGTASDFFRLTRAKRFTERTTGGATAALLVDPDTGVSERASKRHVTFECVSRYATRFALVVVFDQAFVRATIEQRKENMRKKLNTLSRTDPECRGFYYRSHANFLFASRQRSKLKHIRDRLLADGLPENRFFP